MTGKMIQCAMLIILAMTMGCSSPNERAAEQREALARKAAGDIVIALVWNQSEGETCFAQGVNMALDEINGSGGIGGRKIKALQYIGHFDEKEELRLARKVAFNPEVMAIIGHWDSGAAIPASVIYENSGLLFISPGATSSLLTSHGFHLVFRNIPSDHQTAYDLAEFVHASGYKKVAVLDDESVYGQMFADAFLVAVQKMDVQAKIIKSYFPWQNDFRPMLAAVKSQDVDAIFLGGQLPQAASVISQARELGITVPFVGGDGIDSPALWEIAGPAAEGTVVATAMDPRAEDPKLQKFMRDFQSRFGKMPDTWAAQGYDAMKLLANGFGAAKSTLPILVSSYLHYLVEWHGVTGSYSFTQRGDIVGKTLFFKVVHNDSFQYLNMDIQGGKGR